MLEHSGVKGMHWGVRRNANRPGGADGIPDAKDKKRGKLGQHLDSLKRERSWGSTLKEVHNMTTKDINTIKKRIDLENNLKAASKSKMATKKDKLDYLRRHEMSDQEITRKVNRIKAKEGLHKSVKEASKSQRELGIKVAQVGGSIGLKYATAKRLPNLKDMNDLKGIIDIVKNPTVKTKEDAYDSGLDFVYGKTKNRKVKNVLELAKHAKFKPKSKDKDKK